MKLVLAIILFFSLTAAFTQTIKITNNVLPQTEQFNFNVCNPPPGLQAFRIYVYVRDAPLACKDAFKLTISKNGKTWNSYMLVPWKLFKPGKASSSLAVNKWPAGDYLLYFTLRYRGADKKTAYKSITVPFTVIAPVKAGLVGQKN